MDWATIQNALIAWFAAASGLTTIWANQNAPQPAYPYAVLNIISGPVVLGIDETRATVDAADPPPPAGQEIILETCGPRELTVSCQVLSSSDTPPNDARSLLTAAQAALRQIGMTEALNAAGLGVQQADAVMSIPNIANGRWLSRAAMDVRFNAWSSVTERTGYIQTTEAQATFTKEDGTSTTTTETFGATS